MKRRFLAVLTAALIAATGMVACTPKTEDAQPAEDLTEITAETEEAEEAEEDVDVEEADAEEDGPSIEEAAFMKDPAGNEIAIPQNMERIVSMSPSATELLIDLGLADKIIAIDTYSAFSPFVAVLPSDLAQFDMMTPDNEAIIALEPDIVFTTGMSSSHGEDVYAQVKAAGVCVADIPTSSSIKDIEDDIAFFGEITGTQDKAKAINDEIEAFVSSMNDVTSTLESKKTVLYVMSVPTSDYPDVYTCGKGTYMDEVFTLCGLENVAGDIETEWPALSEEDILAKNPDVIIVGDTYTPDAVNAILSIGAWKDIKAVKDKAVYAIDGDAFNQPNQYVMNSAYEIAVAAYPVEFKDLEKPFE